MRNRTDDQAPYFFHQGSSERAYDYLGLHRSDGFAVFRVWAPNADAVSVVGDFNGWDPSAAPMTRVTERGVWEIRIPSEKVLQGQCYKYFIRNGEKELYKADPYGIRMQTPPDTATVVWDFGSYVWRDAGWLRHRARTATREQVMHEPVNVYEMHIGSWMRRADGSSLSYSELARELVPYLKEMGYTHVEFMPLAEYPFDGSWGYQICGYYALTSRFGTPEEFMELVDKLHEAGIGVILDWVPAHFPKDDHGLCEFDGQPLYEYQGSDRMEHRGWGTRRFDVGREEVQSFLISNAVFWIETYHIDGLRVDAVASMLYLDYDKAPGEWVPNIYGNNRCLEAIAFFQKLNGCLARVHPDVLTIAEESTAWANVTNFGQDGLGFSLKWNMGWMNDSLSYLAEDPLWRCDHHNNLTFPISYAYSERFILPVSHDEVVHGKKSLLDRSPGEYELKFAGTRVFLAYMMTHPGKKLLFMGSEIGQFREWDYEGAVEWFLLDYPMHAAFQTYVAALNRFYLSQPALWQRDDEWMGGFEWIDADNAEQSIYSYRRKDAEGKELIVLLNFLPVRRDDFLLAVPNAGIYEELFNSDDIAFGGNGIRNSGQYRTEPCLLRSYGTAIRITIPPMSAVVFHCVRKSPRKKASPTLAKRSTKGDCLICSEKRNALQCYSQADRAADSMP